jgi:bromodomain-containing factor 1
VPALANGTHSFKELVNGLGRSNISDPPIANIEAVPAPAVQQPISAEREGTSELSVLEQVQELIAPPKLSNGVGQGTVHQAESVQPKTAEPINADVEMDTSTSADVPSATEIIETLSHPAEPMVSEPLPEASLDAPATPVAEVPILSTKSEMASPSEDHTMQDAPHSPAKVARSREEDDDEDGPALKRMKAEDDSTSASEFKLPELPQPSVEQVGSPPAIEYEATTPAEVKDSETSTSFLPITKPQQKYLAKSLQNLRRTQAAAAFAQPVDPVALNIPNYLDVVKKPMDLRTMEEKLKTESYESIDAFVADFNKIVENTEIFNGRDHPVTKNAHIMKETFEKSMKNVPSRDVAEPPPPEKKMIAKVKTVPSRRESRSSLGTAKSPVATQSPQTFALGPQGVPLIRRDSTVNDGRPKREIHPPAPRDLPYSNQKPKKKKYQTELKFCQEVINEMKKPRYQTVGFPFQVPVDPVALNIPTYHKIIKRPMDLSTIEKKLKEGQYESAKEFEADIRLMFNNCYKFNPATDGVHQMGKQYEEIFDQKWQEKKSYIQQASGAHSLSTSPEPDDDDDDSEEEQEDKEDEISILQQQIAAMSKQVEAIKKKKKDSPPVPKQRAQKSSKPPKRNTNPPKKERVKDTKPAKTKIPYVNYEQKQDISNRINTLPENRMQTALNIIRENMPNLKVR